MKFKNKLYCGDNLKIMKRLLNKHGAFIDLIYIDTPFFSGKDYNSKVKTTQFIYKWNGGLDEYLT